MSNSIDAFKKQFTPHRDGYLIYPWRQGGGKLVTADEYNQLIADWQKVAGRAGTWKSVGTVVAVLALWTLLSQALRPPEWINSAVIVLVAITICARILWASFAPWRLVKNRKPITPPRPRAEARREARAALNWQMIIFALILSAGAFASHVTATEWNIGTWAWLVGSGAIFVAYIWIGFRKLFDR